MQPQTMVQRDGGTNTRTSLLHQWVKDFLIYGTFLSHDLKTFIVCSPAYQSPSSLIPFLGSRPSLIIFFYLLCLAFILPCNLFCFLSICLSRSFSLCPQWWNVLERILEDLEGGRPRRRRKDRGVLETLPSISRSLVPSLYPVFIFPLPEVKS